MEVGREPGRETGREVVVVGQVLSDVRFMDSARRREVERPLRKDCADWRDLASWALDVSDGGSDPSQSGVRGHSR